MHAFDVLGDPVRRRILELLSDGEQTSGAVVEVVRAEFGISQPAVSQHLRVLRESGFATVASPAVIVDPTGMREVDALEQFRGFGPSGSTRWHRARSRPCARTSGVADRRPRRAVTGGGRATPDTGHAAQMPAAALMSSRSASSRPAAAIRAASTPSSSPSRPGRPPRGST